MTTQTSPPAYDNLASSSSSSAAEGTGASSSPSAGPLASNRPASTSPLASAPHSSHVSVYSHNGAVKAAHILDLGVPVSPALLRAQQQQQSESSSSPRPEEVDALSRWPNGYWASQNGSVTVSVGVRGREVADSALEQAYLVDAGKKGEERVRIVAYSENGNVKCAIVRSMISRSVGIPLTVPSLLQVERSPASTPFTVRAKSLNGSVELILPASFHGPLALQTDHGMIRLSDGVKARFTPLVDGSGFVGDIADWDGDAEQAEAEGWDSALGASKNGSVR